MLSLVRVVASLRFGLRLRVRSREGDAGGSWPSPWAGERQSCDRHSTMCCCLMCPYNQILVIGRNEQRVNSDVALHGGKWRWEIEDTRSFFFFFFA